MARHLLQQVCQVLQTTNVASPCVGRNVAAATQRLSRNKAVHSPSYSYCVYRFWCSLQLGLKRRNLNNSHLTHDGQSSSSSLFNYKAPSILDPRLNLNVRCISQSGHVWTSNSVTKIKSKSTSNSPGASNQNKNDDSKLKKKTSPKSSVKEFIIKENIGDHDMSIKLNKMQSLLDKGKVLEIFIKCKKGSEGSGKEMSANALRVQKRLEEDLQGIKPLRVDYANKHTIKMTAVPMEDQQPDS